MYDKSVLAIDIGGGTQDILLFEPEKTIENCCKLVLPSPTLLIKHKIAQATASGKDVFLTGPIMGGGPSARGVKNHLAAGLSVYATPSAAKTFHDDLDKVAAMGVIIAAHAPDQVTRIQTGDLDLDSLYSILDRYHLPRPQQIAIAVQDHGESVEESNRLVRSRAWADFISSGGNPLDLLFFQAPSHLTRMKAIQEQCSGAVLMDTGPAAIIGALCDPLVKQQESQGITVVNVGNMHTLAFLIKEGRIWGMAEHHTSMLNPAKLALLIDRLQKGLITQGEIYEDGGHGGTVVADRPANSFSFLAVTGPNRGMAASLRPHFAVPYGDMMLTGCFGLVQALATASEKLKDGSK